MSQSSSVESWKSLHDRFSNSVVELAVYKGDSEEPAHYGTGIILCHKEGLVGIITTISCDPNHGYIVFARFDDDDYHPAKVVLKGEILSGLVVSLPKDHKKVFLALGDASFYEADIVKAEPLWAIGCFGDSVQPIMPCGSVCACDVVKYVSVRNFKKQLSFLHSCPIGDGLIGALIINRFHKIVGINVTRTSQTARLNYAMRFKELLIELANLVGEREDFKEPFSDLVKIVERQLFAYRTRQNSAKRRKTNDGSSSSVTRK